MPSRLMLCGTVFLALSAFQPLHAGGEDKPQEVGAGLEIAGELGKTRAVTYQVKLAKGKTYVLIMVSPDQEALDPLLRLLDASGKQPFEVQYDGGENMDGRLYYKVETEGTYQVVAASVGNGRGPYTLTVREGRDELALQTKRWGPGHWKVTDTRLGLADAERFSKIDSKFLALVGKAAALNRKAKFSYQAGMPGEAAQRALDALEIIKELMGEKTDYAGQLLNVAFYYNAQGNHAKAESLYFKFLEITKEVQGEKHPSYGSGLIILAEVYRSQGNYAKAEPLFLKALENTKEALGEKHRKYAASLNSLGEVYRSQGNYAKAEALHQQALAIRKHAVGEKHLLYATSLNHLATLYNAQGNHAKAEPLLLKALNIYKEAGGEKHRDYADILNNLAFLYFKRENYSKTEPLFLKALEITKEVLGEKHPSYALSLINLASLYSAQGNHSKAEPLLLKALNIYKEVGHRDYALCLNNLAGLYNDQGNHGKAEPLFLTALKIKKAVLGENHPSYALSLNNLASLYVAQGNHGKAEPLYVKALVASQISKTAIAIEDLRSEHLRIDLQTVTILENHGWLLERQATKDHASKNLRSCDHSYRLALNLLERVRQEKIDHQESKIDLIADRFHLFPSRIGVLRKLFVLERRTEDLEAAFWTAEQGTARAFLETIGSDRVNLLAGVSAARQEEETQLLQDIRLLDVRIDTESAKTLQQRNPDLVGELLRQRHEADKKLQRFIATLDKEYPQYANLRYPRPCTLKQARSCLKDDELALLFVLGKTESYIVLVEARPKPGDGTNGLDIYELPGAEVLAGQVAALKDLETLALPVRVKALGREAYDTLLGPCKERIQGKNLVIVSGGSLGLLPFELLVGEDGKYLVENHRIRYAPSLTALHFINLWKQKRAAPTEPLFAVGDPIYEGGDVRVTNPNPKKAQVASTTLDWLRDLGWREGNRDDFKRLVHCGTELAEIAKILNAKADFVRTGEKASEAEIKEPATAKQMALARYIHFATHGILGVDKSKQPALVLNLVGNTNEDGFLHRDEILNLKLNADLVVLSACRTGQGRMARGEGVTGLARAFLYAGSKGVVCSLWSVEDRETSNLMVAFYRNLQKNQPAPEALRSAQLAMIRAGRPPLYWAPFILIGE